MAEKNEQHLENVELNVLRTYTKDLTFVLNENNFPQSASPEEAERANAIGFAVDVQVHDLQQDDLVDISVFLNLVIGDREAPVVKYEALQGGIFRAKNLPEEVKSQALYYDCAAVLWPFITNNLDNLLVKAGIPPLYLGCQDFRAIFQQTLASRQQQAQAQAAAQQ